MPVPPKTNSDPPDLDQPTPPDSGDQQQENGGPVPSDAPPAVLPVGKEGTLYWTARGLVRTMRPHQWVKNVFVLAPVVFAKELFRFDELMRAGEAFVIYCLLTGCIYTINDIVDAPSDRVHPVKRRRPIASGQVSIRTAKVLAVVLFAASMGGALRETLTAVMRGILRDSLTAAVREILREPPLFALVALTYFLINIAYSFKLKKIAYVDVACIATGFVLRVVAGGLATGIVVSGYLLICTALLALFLGFGKRRHELAGAPGRVTKQRASLEAYSSRALSMALAATGVTSIATYVAYTLDPATRQMFHSDWLWVTAANPIFGVVRFLQLMRSRHRAESPTQEMLRDTPFVLNVIVWVVLVFVLVYKLKPSAGF
jgi:decaprenyl-phosphate phosphoribosyltransferase